MTPTARLLVADVGGTNIRFAMASQGASAPLLHNVQTVASKQTPDLASAIATYLAQHKFKPDAIVLGVAGPVLHRTASLTNLGWTIDADALALRFNCRVHLLNDLEACAHGVTVLAHDDYTVLQWGRPARGNKAVIAAGTGLGEAGLLWDGSRYIPWACEGGHCDFAPRSDLDIELLTFLRHRFGRVSWERVLSGPGLVNIYQFLCQRLHGTAPVESGNGPGAHPTPETITAAALKAECDTCVNTVKLFARYYAIEAANLALKTMSVAGLYIAGGIAKVILPFLQDQLFKHEFLNVGRVRHILEAMPVYVVTNPHVTLLGAAQFGFAQVT